MECSLRNPIGQHNLLTGFPNTLAYIQQIGTTKVLRLILEQLKKLSCQFE